MAKTTSERKPDTAQAMQGLLATIAREMPLYAPEAHLCRKNCVGCPKKLMQFLENTYEHWQYALESGETPSLGDIQKLAKTATKIQAALRKNGIVKA